MLVFHSANTYPRKHDTAQVVLPLCSAGRDDRALLIPVWCLGSLQNLHATPPGWMSPRLISPGVAPAYARIASALTKSGRQATLPML